MTTDASLLQMPAHQRRRDRARPRIALHLTAMIDVVFLLLVYFMVATEFKVGEEIYRLDLPERLTSQRALDPFDLDEQPLRVLVATTGFGLNTYTVRLDGPYDQPRTFDELFEFLRNRQINEVTRSGLFEPDHPIVIEPTRTTKWQHVVEAFNAAARARYTNITFAAAR
ncbi:MAG: ExbD/TolR family protein [Planctomycetota bacterium]